uniref:Uncharacterized protein n=1 Tax=Populus trichocarpa TaxID=3694 RepID=B9N8Z1_POPTR
MASPTSAPLFQQPVSVRWILSKTLTGFWLEASNDGDFAGSSMAPLPDELAVSPCLLGLICPVHCLGDGQFDGCPHWSVAMDPNSLGEDLSPIIWATSMLWCRDGLLVIGLLVAALCSLVAAVVRLLSLFCRR